MCRYTALFTTFYMCNQTKIDMINLIKGRELLSTVVDDITNKLREKQNKFFLI